MAARTDRPTVERLTEGVRAGDRAALGRAITLMESTRDEDRADARALLAALGPDAGGATRVGITGVPGVGKSTFIERLGTRLTGAGRRVAVLAVDPSSTVRGGSILGDKTRMETLASDERAFVRPSPSAGALGGVASRTREALLLCEAAGYDVVLVETMGVGQSETAVAGMTDFLLALMLPGAGDELQSIKRGLLEAADLIAINKADGDRRAAAERAAVDFRNALRYLAPKDPDWEPPVVLCSAQDDEGIRAIWEAVERHRTASEASGRLAARRRDQALAWMRQLVDEGLRSAFAAHPDVRARLQETERAVRAETLPATAAAERLLEAFRRPASDRTEPPEEETR